MGRPVLLGVQADLHVSAKAARSYHDRSATDRVVTHVSACGDSGIEIK